MGVNVKAQPAGGDKSGCKKDSFTIIFCPIKVFLVRMSRVDNIHLKSSSAVVFFFFNKAAKIANQGYIQASRGLHLLPCMTDFSHYDSQLRNGHMVTLECTLMLPRTYEDEAFESHGRSFFCWGHLPAMFSKVRVAGALLLESHS